MHCSCSLFIGDNRDIGQTHLRSSQKKGELTKGLESYRKIIEWLFKNFNH